MATVSVRHTGWNDWNQHALGDTPDGPNNGEGYIINYPGGSIVNHPLGIAGQKAFQPAYPTGITEILLVIPDPNGGNMYPEVVDGAQLALRVTGPPLGTPQASFFIDIIGYGIVNGSAVEMDRHPYGLEVQPGGSSSASGAYLSGDIKYLHLQPRNPPAGAQWWLTYAGVPGAPINGPLFKVDWWELLQVSTVLHPTRQHPRSDGLGASSARRRYPAPGSVQGSARRYGTYT